MPAMTTAVSLRRALCIAALACLPLCLVWGLAKHSHLMVAIPVLGLAGTFMSAISLPGERPTRQTVLPAQQDQPVGTDFGSGRQISRVLIVGMGTVGQRLAQSLESGGKHTVIGFVDENIPDISPNFNPSRWPVLGQRHAIATIISEHAIDEVCLAYVPTWQQQLAEQLTAECPQVGLHVVPSSYEALLHVGRIRSYGDIALASLEPRTTGVTQAIKRAFDVAIAMAVLALLAPLWALIAALIKLTSAGPVIFAQERVGLHGRRFYVLKFRTMRQDAEAATGPVLSEGKLDNRLTSIGRYLRLFRIDEVPQLWNVLCGEMSLVGPRPERPIFVERYGDMLPSYARRHEVRPGITGLAQVCGGYHTDARDKLRFDLIYLSHLSIWFDLFILMRTILVVLIPDDRH